MFVQQPKSQFRLYKPIDYFIKLFEGIMDHVADMTVLDFATATNSPDWKTAGKLKRQQLSCMKTLRRSSHSIEIAQPKLQT